MFYSFKLHYSSVLRQVLIRARLVRWMWPALAPSCRGKGGSDSQGARLQPGGLPALGRSQGKSFGAKGLLNPRSLGSEEGEQLAGGQGPVSAKEVPPAKVAGRQHCAVTLYCDLCACRRYFVSMCRERLQPKKLSYFAAVRVHRCSRHEAGALPCPSPWLLRQSRRWHSRPTSGF